jgi:uncharacterized protein YodC (DUF2158 family)
VAAVSIVALLALAASMALMQPAAVAPKGGTAEGLGLKGVVEITVRDAQGNVKYHEVIPNAIVANGLEKLVLNTFAVRASDQTTPKTAADRFQYITFVATSVAKAYTPSAYVTPATEVDADDEYWVSDVIDTSSIISNTYKGVQIKACVAGSSLGATEDSAVTVNNLLITNGDIDVTDATSISVSFTKNGGVTFTISGGSKEGDYSSKVFSGLSTSIPLYGSDTLTVTWTLGLAAS